MEQEETNESSQANADQTFQEFLKKPTTVPVDLTITMTNFLDEQDARRCGDVMRGYLDVFGRLMDLRKLCIGMRFS